MTVEMAPRKTDLSHRRHRVALIVPSSNTVMENDLHAALPKARYTVHTDRMYLVETTREAEQRMIEEHARPAAIDLGTAQPDLLVFGCTSGGSLFGLNYDAQICADLGRKAGCPAIGVISSVSRALAKRKVRRLAVITPYVEELTCAVADALRSDECEIVASAGMGISVNVELADPTPEDIVAFAQSQLHGHRFDTLFVSCTNFRALEAKAKLEERFSASVVTSNSATIEAIREHFEGAEAGWLEEDSTAA